MFQSPDLAVPSEKEIQPKKDTTQNHPTLETTPGGLPPQASPEAIAKRKEELLKLAERLKNL